MQGTFEPDARGLAEVLAALTGFVIVVDADGVIRYVNRTEEGYDLDEIVGAPLWPLVQPGSEETVRAALEAVLAGEAEATYEVRTPAPDGSEEWYRSRMVPLTRDEAGRVTAVLITAQRVTELKEAQERLAKLRRLVPVCAWCDRIRDESGEWLTLEAYVGKREDTSVTHGLCPRCAERQMAELDERGA